MTQTTRSVALGESDESKGLSGLSTDYADYTDSAVQAHGTGEVRNQKPECRSAESDYCKLETANWKLARSAWGLGFGAWSLPHLARFAQKKRELSLPHSKAVSRGPLAVGC
jgi:hypothetical protein